MSVELKPKKISDLPEITKEELTLSDLFVVSDIDAPQGKTSKKLTFGTLSSVVSDMVPKEITKEVVEEVTPNVVQAVTPITIATVTPILSNDFKTNINNYAPIQEWNTLSGVVKETYSVEIGGVATTFEDFVVDGGSADE